jgi:RNA polymerase sigma factor for flagellar operon FliA
VGHLSDDALASAWGAYHDGRAQDDRNVLVLHYTSLVRYVAAKVAATLPSMVERDDLVSYGVFGLMDAIAKFDPDKGVKFETYAVARIRGHIIDELRHLDWVPRSVRSKARDVERSRAGLESQLGRPPEDSELAESMGLSVPELWQLMSQAAVVSVSALQENDGDDRLSVGDVAFDPTANPEDLFEAGGEITGMIAKAIDSMPQRSKTILALYYLQDMTLAEIGEILGVTESRVCQLQSKALSGLGDYLSEGLVNA